MEIWKDMTGYEGLYQVSNLGRVKSLNFIKKTKRGFNKKYSEKILKGHINNTGYDCYDLYDLNGKRKNIKGHFLVAYHFCKGYNPDFVVNHINGIKTDNRLENLELICPNCHSLTPHYGGLNLGNGRRKRAEKLREWKQNLQR
jgi:hypothetical protein